MPTASERATEPEDAKAEQESLGDGAAEPRLRTRAVLLQKSAVPAENRMLLILYRGAQPPLLELSD